VPGRRLERLVEKEDAEDDSGEGVRRGPGRDRWRKPRRLYRNLLEDDAE
jgi:hypothetical protein